MAVVDHGVGAVGLGAAADGDAGGAATLVTVAVEGSGLGLVDAFETPQALTSGVDGTPGTQGQIRNASGVPYWCTVDATTATAGAWKQITLS